MWLVHCLQEEWYIVFVLSQRDSTTAYDKDHTYFIVSEILEALKKGNGSNIRGLLWLLA